MKHPVPALPAALGAICLLAALPASAQAPAQTDLDQIETRENTEVRPNAGTYWTAERFKAARPMPFPTVRPEALHVEHQASAPAPTPESSDGQPPSHRSKVVARRLYMPGVATPDAERQRSEPERRPPERRAPDRRAPERRAPDGGTVEPQANGTFGTPFTSTRVPAPTRTSRWASCSSRLTVRRTYARHR